MLMKDQIFLSVDLVMLGMFNDLLTFNLLEMLFATKIVMNNKF